MKRAFRAISLVVTVLLVLSLSACWPPPLVGVLGETGNTLTIRSIQTREYDSKNPVVVMRAVISTLQDLDFVIDQADSRLGLVTATKVHQYRLRITVLVEALTKGRVQVRASCHMGAYRLSDAGPVSEPEPYQEFFASLGKNLSFEQNSGS